jgi:hypothetical protein
MKVNLQGARVRQIRESLGMTVPQFSSVIAVHPGTVHRWESAGALPVTIDGVAANVLAALDQKLNSGQQFQPNQVGDEVVRALLVGGALVALGLLIAELVGGKKP